MLYLQIFAKNPQSNLCVMLALYLGKLTKHNVMLILQYVKYNEHKSDIV